MSRFSRKTLAIWLWVAACYCVGCQDANQPAPIPTGIGGLESAEGQGDLNPDSQAAQVATHEPQRVPHPVAPAPPPLSGSMPAPLTTVSPPFDLLERIDPKNDSRNGLWTKRDGALVSPNTAAAALEIPYQPAPAYRWTVVAQRLSGSESLALGFVIEHRNAMCVLEGWGKKFSGLNLLDGQTGDNNATTVREPVLVDGPNTIVLTVRHHRVQCEVNGRMIIDWKGEPHRLALDRRYWSKLDNGALFLGTWDASYLISKCQVEVLPLSEALGSR